MGLQFHAEPPRGPQYGTAGLTGFSSNLTVTVNPHCCRTGNLGPQFPERVAGVLRLPPDAAPSARAVTHPNATNQVYVMTHDLLELLGAMFCSKKPAKTQKNRELKSIWIWAT